jgi:predicted membrane channel-forming protein YqfA (hemolysin III family)
MEERSDSFVRKFVLVFGVVLVVFGGVILFYIGYLVFQVINHPEEVRIVEHILAQFKSGDLALYGNLEEKRFTLHLAEPLKTAIFLFLGMLIVWVLARIVQSLISGGIQMLSFAIGRSKGSGGIPRSDNFSDMES